MPRTVSVSCALVLAAIALAVPIASSTLIYHTYNGTLITQQLYDAYVASNTSQYCALVINECDPKEGRRVDGSCNNLNYPVRGAGMTPYLRLLEPVYYNGDFFRRSQSGKELPNARMVRTALLKEERVIGRQFTHLLINTLTGITGDVQSIHDTMNYVIWKPYCCQEQGKSDPECIPISIPNDDPVLGSSNVKCLNLTRALTYQNFGCLPTTETRERYNSNTPVLDLSGVYGTADSALAQKGRSFEGGKMKVDTEYGHEFPPTNVSVNANVCFQNRLPEEKMCFDPPNTRLNGLFGIMITNVYFWRFHNYIAEQLAKINPCWNDEQLFHASRYINIAVFQQIATYEAMPIVLGKEYAIQKGVISRTPGFVDNYDPKIPPQISLEFNFALRWFHTVQEGAANFYNHDGSLAGGFVEMVDLSLRPGLWPINNTIEKLTQDSFRQAGAPVDSLVDPGLAERALGNMQKVADVFADDLMKNRDQGIPSYNKYRQFCGLKMAKCFEDLQDTMTKERASALSRIYEEVDDVDLQAGLWAESSMKDAIAGKVLGCLIAEQFSRFRKSDRFWFEHPGVPHGLTAAQLAQIRKATMARLMCEVADDVDQIQPEPFRVISPSNKVTKCTDTKATPVMDFTPWKDPKCSHY